MTASASFLPAKLSLLRRSPTVLSTGLSIGSECHRRVSNIADSMLNTSIQAAWYLTLNKSWAIFATFSKIFSSYTEGSRMTLSGIKLTRKEIKHSEAEIRILCEDEVRNSETM